MARFVQATLTSDARALGFFRELTSAVARITGQPTAGALTYLVPADALGMVQQRDLKAATAAAGGYLVGTSVPSFASTLKAASLIGRLPLTLLPDLVGSVTIPRDTLRGTVGWVSSEGDTAAPDIAPSLGQMALVAKVVHGSVPLSRHWVAQTGAAAQAYVDRVLAETVADGVDTALLQGSGVSGQPTGIFSTSGIDTRTGASLTWNDVVAMRKVVDGWDATSTIAWVAGITAAEVARKRERAAGSGFIAERDEIDGRPLLVSRSAPAAGLVVAPWSQVWMASWGALEVAVDPFTQFRDGRAIVRLRWPVDFGVARPASIAVASAVS